MEPIRKPEQWYHGSPLRLEILRAGSTITGEIELARVFSHKPPMVSLDGEAGSLRLRHNGRLPGFLYEVEGVEDADVTPHPNSSMPAGLEWITQRDLPLRFLGPTVVDPVEFLSDVEIARFLGRD